MKTVQRVQMRVEENLKNNKGMPDEELMKAVSERVKQSDCVVNGWVMDGFPNSQDQIQMLKTHKIFPSLVC